MNKILDEATKTKIKSDIISKINKSFDTDSVEDGIPIYKVILYILDLYNSGGFYGELCIKFMGIKIKRLFHKEMSLNITTKYEYLEK